MPAANDNEGTARVFLALWPDAAARARLADCRDAWRWPPGARLVGDAKLHLTLHFIGALARSPLDDLQAALAEVPPGRVALHLPGGELGKKGASPCSSPHPQRRRCSPCTIVSAARWMRSVSRSTGGRSRRT